MRIIQKPKILEFRPLPYDEDFELRRDDVELFHQWLLTRLRPGIYGSFQLAEVMDVHRIISEPWEVGLIEAELATEHTFTVRETCVDGFNLQSKTYSGNVVIRWNDYQEYDPWTDRSLDSAIPDALYPDLFIDKFYEVCSSEYYIVTKKARQRLNGVTFEPLSISEHPRYENPAKAGSYTGKVPPAEWRKIIDQAV